MLSYPKFSPSLDEQPQPNEIRRAQLATFARQTPINTAVTVTTALLTAAILWPVAPPAWVLLWTGMHIALVMTVFSRWWHYRQHRPKGRVGTRGLRKAMLWAALSGLTWGSGAAFLPVVPTTQQLALIIVIGAMAGGASTTLGAVPQAASLFIGSSILPVAAYFVLQGELVYLGLAALALVMATAMLASTRIVYGAFMEDLRTKQANAALLAQFHAERQEWLEISETAEAFALFDAADRLLLWNENYRLILSLPPESLFRGAERKELLCQCAPPVAVERDDMSLASWIEAQLRLHEHPDVPSIEKLANGRWLRSSARRTARGCTVTVHVDITELKQAEETLREREAELRQSQKLEAIGKLAGGVAHDFNNLLTVILGYAQILLSKIGDDPAQTESANQISRAAERAAALTRQLLAFSRKQMLQPKVVDLNTVICDMEQMLRRLIPETITIGLDLAPALGHVKVDPNQIEQVILNLVVNACDAMLLEGKIRIQTHNAELDEHEAGRHAEAQPGAYVALTVSDTGHGMDAATQEHIFEPFFTTKRQGKGTGLGLATVYGIVKQSGGNIWLSSALEQGSTFQIHLPRVEAALDVTDQRSSPTAIPAGSETILVVEDEDMVRALICDTLQHQGYIVLEAERPTAALQLCDTHPSPIHLILSDVVMPEMTGWSLVEQAKARRPEAKVLYMSGYTADTLDRHGVLAPDVPLMAKPFSPYELAMRVRQALDRD